MRTARIDGAGAGGADTQGVAVHHALDFRIALETALEVRPLRQLDEVPAAVLPRLAAVEAAHDAADLQRDVDFIRVGWIEGNAHHAAGKLHLDAFGQLRCRQTAPGLAGVVAAVDADRLRAGVDDAWVTRMQGDSPYLRERVGQGQMRPAFAAVLGAVRTAVRADVDDSRFRGVRCDRLHLRPVGEAPGQLLPVAAVCLAAEDAAARVGISASSADVDMRCECHADASFGSIAAYSRSKRRLKSAQRAGSRSLSASAGSSGR